MTTGNPTVGTRTSQHGGNMDITMINADLVMVEPSILSVIRAQPIIIKTLPDLTPWVNRQGRILL